MTRTLLITAGSRGIGAATARLAAVSGYDVAFTYVGNRQAADAVCRDVEAAGRTCLVIQADTGRPQDIERLFAETDRSFPRLDAFFNNAGVFAAPSKFVDIPLERLSRTLDVNTRGAFLAAQQAVRRMSTRLGGAGGAIVNMSSVAAKLGGSHEATDYGMSKGAVDTLTIGLAKEVAAEGIRVNAVRPGLIHTDIHATAGQPGRVERLAPQIPMQRGGTAEEVAQAVLWLLSDNASYVTGTIVDVAGGRGI